MTHTPGTAGYEQDIERFLKSSWALDFAVVNADFLTHLPTAPATVLDVGSGAGQNAAALAQRGYTVVAVEPQPEFLKSARSHYDCVTNITWLADSLPTMERVGPECVFDFILVDGVWHHLNETEREQAMARCVQLLNPGGRLAISLRKGPPGMGLRCFPTDPDSTLFQAQSQGLTCLLDHRKQPSIYAHKQNVTWSRLVLEAPR